MTKTSIMLSEETMDMEQVDRYIAVSQPGVEIKHFLRRIESTGMFREVEPRDQDLMVLAWKQPQNKEEIDITKEMTDIGRLNMRFKVKEAWFQKQQGVQLVIEIESQSIEMIKERMKSSLPTGTMIVGGANFIMIAHCKYGCSRGEGEIWESGLTTHMKDTDWSLARFTKLKKGQILWENRAETSVPHTRVSQSISLEYESWPRRIKDLVVHNIVDRTGSVFGRCHQKRGLAHWTSEDMAMDSLVGREMVKRYPGITRYYQSEGLGTTYQYSGPGYWNRHIFSMIIRRNNDDSIVDTRDVYSALLDMKRKAGDYDIQEIAMPEPSREAGLKGADWPEIRACIEEVFKNSKMIISIYHDNDLDSS